MTKTTNTRCYLSKRQLLNLLTVANLFVDSVDKTSFRVFRFRTNAAPLRANLILIFFFGGGGWGGEDQFSATSTLT